jgi:hypothetical protein
LRLFPSLIIVGLLSLRLFAEEGQVYPDSAMIEFTWQVNFDTVSVRIHNLSTQPVEHFFLSDFTDSQTIFIDCLIDGVLVDSLPIDIEFGSVYPGKFTTRWVISEFSDSLLLRYYTPFYNGNKMTWSAGQPYAIFGLLPGIGPPLNLSWRQ